MANSTAMPQSLSRVLVHIVFSTKDRAELIPEPVLAPLHAYLGGICRSLGCAPLAIGGVGDHVHLGVDLSRTLTLAKLVEQVKVGSSVWVKRQTGVVSTFAWQRGYGVFSVSSSDAATLRAYIEAQADHHRRIGFQDEYRALLREFGMEFDERYLWDSGRSGAPGRSSSGLQPYRSEIGPRPRAAP